MSFFIGAINFFLDLFPARRFYVNYWVYPLSFIPSALTIYFNHHLHLFSMPVPESRQSTLNPNRQPDGEP